ncbi:uncharacterized protein LOC126740463 [Anthonomus grandis grandis]|uniref:uncharacterized protein LOC126740463 n=1 Tax=Anthonomus grandis grandis TaxID=2921223 RepID=UPI0021653816|nr:uncharacterized protein LOC126740463 [Anthonomus grandis grandis]
MAEDCVCGEPVPPPSQRRFPKMGVSSLGPRPPPSINRSAGLNRTPPNMPITVPGLSRNRAGDKTLTPGSANKTATNTSQITTCKEPDYAKYGTAMEELSKLEFVEMQNIEDDLRDFHIKRRKLVFNITSLNLSKARRCVKKAVTKMGF